MICPSCTIERPSAIDMVGIKTEGYCGYCKCEILRGARCQVCLYVRNPYCSCGIHVDERIKVVANYQGKPVKVGSIRMAQTNGILLILESANTLRTFLTMSVGEAEELVLSLEESIRLAKKAEKHG